MVKKNYAAWKIAAKDFSEDWPDREKLAFFARYAILAPSGHNTQPWHFSHVNESLVLRNNPARHLPYSGTQAAEPYISLGTCLETLCLAAKGFGYKLLVKYDFRDDSVATIALDGKVTADPALLNAIIHRTSNRNPFERSGLSTQLLQGLTQTSLKDATPYLVSSRTDISFIAEQTARATLVIMGDPKFRLELSKWVRNNMTKQHDGMPGYTQGMPTPPSMIAKHIIKRINISASQAKLDAGRIIDSADLVLIQIKNQSKEAFLDAGRLYARICVIAEQHGVSTSGVGAAVIDPLSKKAIKERFNLPYQPVAIIRLGKTSKRARHTPRWPLEQVLDKK